MATAPKKSVVALTQVRKPSLASKQKEVHASNTSGTDKSNSLRADSDPISRSITRTAPDAKRSKPDAILVEAEGQKLVVAHQDREDNVRALAEAWGLDEHGSDEESNDEGDMPLAEERGLNRGTGLGASKGREETNKNSLEARIERAQQKKRRVQEPSVELSQWMDVANEEDESITLTKSRSAKEVHKGKRTLRIQKTFDTLLGQPQAKTRK